MLIQTPEVKTPIIRVRNLEKSYGVNQVLRGINMDVYPGQIVGYIGPNVLVNLQLSRFLQV